MLGTLYESWAHQVKGGHLPLWFPEFGAGYPVHAAWMYGLFYPPLAVFLALPTETAWTWLAILHLIFGALGMYAFLWDERRDEFAAASGAVVFALSDFMLQRVVAGHMNIVMPMAWAPWVLLAAARTVRGERGASALLGVCTGVGLVSGHAQVWFYVGPLVAAFAVMETARAGAWRKAPTRLALGVALALGIAAIQWIPAFELFEETGHPQEQERVVAACSAPVFALAAQVAPRFAETPTEFLKSERELGRPDLRHEFVGLAGPLAVAGALLALRLRDRRRWFWFGALAFGLVLATGYRNDVGKFLNDLPPFRFARAPGRGMTLVVIAGSVLAGNLVADWFGGLATKWRALAPPAFAASALLFGTPAPGSVKKDFYEYDWSRAMPAEAKEHRVYQPGSRYPYLERSGFRTLRRICPVEPPGYRRISNDMPEPVAAWWLDTIAKLELPTTPGTPPPADLAATESLAELRRVTPMNAGGRLNVFGAAASVSDDEAFERLHSGEHALFLPLDAPAASWRASDLDALRRVRVAPWSDPDRIVLTTDGPCSGPVLLSERWYPGWTTSPPSVVARGNLAFVAVQVEAPAGGAVEIRYRPWWKTPALATSLASLAAALVLVFRRRRDARP